MTIWSVVGFLAACLTMFSFVPQIIKVIKTRSAHDVSLVMLVQLAAGVSLWIVYGVHLRDSIIIMANVVTLACLVVLMSLYWRYGYRKKRSVS